VESLHKSVVVSVEKLKRPGLSVFAAEGVSRAELLEMSPQVRHPLLSFSTAERIYNAGFEMEQTFSLGGFERAAGVHGGLRSPSEATTGDRTSARIGDGRRIASLTINDVPWGGRSGRYGGETSAQGHLG